MNQNMQFILNKMSLDKKAYSSARYDLFFIVALTAINIIILVAGGDSYMLFSAYIPYMFAIEGMILAGRVEGYEDLASGFGDISLYIGLAFAVVIIGAYVVMAILSKKHYGFMIAGTALFSIDSLILLMNFSSALIIDLALHAAIVIMLIRGCIAGKRYSDAEKHLMYLQQDAALRNSDNQQYGNYGDFQGYQAPENTYFQNDQGYQNPPDSQNQSDNGEDKE